MGNIRTRLMKDSMVIGKNDPIAKNFIKVLVSELDRETKSRGGVSESDAFIKILKSTKKSLQISNTEESLHEMTYLDKYMEEYLPPPIDLKSELEKFLSEFEGSPNMGVIMKYFSTNYKDRYDGKTLRDLALEYLK